MNTEGAITWFLVVTQLCPKMILFLSLLYPQLSCTKSAESVLNLSSSLERPPRWFCVTKHLVSLGNTLVHDERLTGQTSRFLSDWFWIFTAPRGGTFNISFEVQYLGIKYSCQIFLYDMCNELSILAASNCLKANLQLVFFTFAEFCWCCTSDESPFQSFDTRTNSLKPSQQLNRICAIAV